MCWMDVMLVGEEWEEEVMVRDDADADSTALERERLL